MKTCEKCGGTKEYQILTSACVCQPETGDWKWAMRMTGEDKEIEFYYDSQVGWLPLIVDPSCHFYKSMEYRIKPSPPPDVVEFQNDYADGSSGYWYPTLEDSRSNARNSHRGIIKKITKPDGKVRLEYIPKEK